MARKHCSGYTWQDDMMEKVQLDMISLHEFKKLAQFSVIRKLWRASSRQHEHLRHLDSLPLLQPTLTLLNVQSPVYIGHRLSSVLWAYLSGKFSVCSCSACTCGQGFFLGGAGLATSILGLPANLPLSEGVRLAGRNLSSCS
jgi:hypothetical protein